MPRSSERLAGRVACAWTLALLLPICAAAASGGGAAAPPARATASRDDVELLQRVVSARVSPAEHLLPAAIREEEEEEESNATHPLLKGPHRALLRMAHALRRQNPALWLMVATMLVKHGQGNTEKASDLAALRSQVELGEDYHIAIVTTAALPWMTGTAVNPLLRAAHLARAGKRVTLMVPWLHPLEQKMVFPNGLHFDTPAEQEAHMRAWLLARAGLRVPFKITFYPGRYDHERGSILPLGDITRYFDP